MKTIDVPEVIWALGDREPSTQGGITTERRPIYYKGRRVGEVDPDYAGQLFDALTTFNFLTHLLRQRAWSERTFGPGARTAGVIDHIRKELYEIEADPLDLSEWIDVAILALDGAWRAGHPPEDIIAALVAKQTKNEARNWPDWRTAPADKAIEHDRVEQIAPADPPSPAKGEE